MQDHRSLTRWIVKQRTWPKGGLAILRELMIASRHACVPVYRDVICIVPWL